MLAFDIYIHDRKISYFFRTIWGSPLKPFNIIPYYYHENVSMETLCNLHGWGIREFPRNVYDATLFSNELDILTLSWNELYPYVRKFVLLESNSTFTGIPKKFNFAMNRDQFKFVEPRLNYRMVGGRFKTGENPFVEEAYQTVALDHLLRIAGIEDDDLLIMSDVGEISSTHTINMLRWCDEISQVLHLHMRNYQLGVSVHQYRKGVTFYAHYRQIDAMLTDSGRYYNFCFKHINVAVQL